MRTGTPLRDFIRNLAEHATPEQWAVQAAIVLAAVLLAWLIGRTICNRFTPSPKWRFGSGEFRRVITPFLALAFVWLSKITLERLGEPAEFLKVTDSLLVAFLVIRAAVYILGNILPPGDTLRLVVRAIAWIVWIAVALHITGLLPEVLDGLDDIGITVGKGSRVTLLLVIEALAAMAVTLTIALWLARVTSGRVLAAQSVEMSTRVVIVKVVNTAAVVLAVLIALPMAGIDLTALSVFGGALGVGLGFGLQKVAASYVSGFIVLLERSLRIGDVITVENRRGVVEAIESRYTVIKSGDGTETIVPNESLITKDVIHHTYADTRVASVIAVNVAYETDADRACELLLRIGKRNPRVIETPAPLARVATLGEHGIHMELVVWIDDPEKGEADLRSEILRDILRTFAAEGIKLAGPRRDVRLITTPEISNTVSASST